MLSLALPLEKGFIRNRGVPIVAWWKQSWLVSVRMWVRSLASLSGLRIRCCPELWCGSQTHLCCCGCGVCRQLELQFHPPLVWELPYALGGALKKRGGGGERKTLNIGDSIVVYWDQWHLWSSGTQVWFLAQHSGLRIQCLQLWCWSKLLLGSNP